MKKSLLATIVLSSLFAVSTASAVVTSGMSDKVTLTLPQEGSAAHNGWFHKDDAGLPGVRVKNSNLKSEKVTSFKSLTSITKRTQWLRRFGGVDSNGVVVLKMSNMPSWVPGFHNELGDFAFKKVGNQELYFGEWLGHSGNPSKDRVVYYAGNEKTQTMPTSGKAVYSVQGINQNNDLNKALLKGEFTADFGKKRLDGTLSKSNLNITVKARIKSDASFGGRAVANNNVRGSAKGHFFGKDASALAGYTKFEVNNQYDTAFGGTKK
ncbi:MULTISPECIES: Slam-dependent surface lipoprotein [Pasteurellaceae]|uniref:Slam-dependent surface lipoprotein n=1 Tax=Pasteurella atlantica TaxID=2827233 RepID=A0AAW8CNF7_9PAST|nr:Slam-dependent surface lipoprotein [Pasteurella atlantica]MBR0573126.1 transferrin-binding protein-like solute binding protein [Pasteurella atlantica]MDP8039017.1 Slam-dependent surface lipoprotein [Pasteurella atlantica]MDP8041107.1 Slam-dependent surface lipoprotein [Pasteurella atlantica]MDP8043280.1 Slam-dependent surface lipoprotein [Pasteurella atlantica]MDP8045366.1 Slam-dependent surface lipoprotein [Pasteurella atlantica]